MPLSNPFFHRGPICDRAYFFGRKDEVDHVLSFLANHQSISLVAQRRIGKTSLLFHIADPGIFTRRGLRPDRHLFVYIDCSGLGDLDQSGLYRVFLEEIRDSLADRGVSPGRFDALNRSDPISYRVFERALRGLARQNWQPILLLDEFEQMSYNPHLDPDFFSGLRALAAKYRLTYVIASKQPLLKLTYADASALSSPFFNIFASLRLGLFSEEESSDLLVSLAAREQIAYTSSTIRFILDLAGRHPLFLQIAGFHAFDLQHNKNGPLTSEDYVELRRRFYASAEEHLAYYWHNLSATQQHVLATLPISQARHADVVRQLERDCLVLRRPEGHDYLSSAFRDFVRAQPVPGLFQAGPIVIDESQHEALLDGHPLNLTLTHYNLLAYLVKQAGQVISAEQLEQALWGEVYVEDPDRLKSALKGLRRALGAEAERLENVRGVGYVWRS